MPPLATARRVDRQVGYEYATSLVLAFCAGHPSGPTATVTNASLRRISLSPVHCIGRRLASIFSRQVDSGPSLITTVFTNLTRDFFSFPPSHPVTSHTKYVAWNPLTGWLVFYCLGISRTIRVWPLEWMVCVSHRGDTRALIEKEITPVKHKFR